MESRNLLPFVLVSLLLLAPAARAGDASLDHGRTAELVSVYEGNGSEAAFVERLTAAMEGRPGGNMMAVLYFVFAESIEQQNEDKKAWISKLRQQNAIAEALAEYLERLEEAAEDLRCISEKRRDCRDGLGNAENAVRAFEVELRRAVDLPEDAMRELRVMAKRDRQLFARARSLEQRVRASAPDAKPVPRAAQPLQPTPPPDPAPPVRRSSP
jgi:hypothetical protein